MDNLMAKLKVIFTAAPTYLTAVGLVVAILINELADFADIRVVANVIRYLGTAAVVIATATSIIRRVTPVMPWQRGVLPVDAPERDPLPGDRGYGMIELAIGVLVLLILLFLVLRLFRAA